MEQFLNLKTLQIVGIIGFSIATALKLYNHRNPPPKNPTSKNQQMQKLFNQMNNPPHSSSQNPPHSQMFEQQQQFQRQFLKMFKEIFQPIKTAHEIITGEKIDWERVNREGREISLEEGYGQKGIQEGEVGIRDAIVEVGEIRNIYFDRILVVEKSMEQEENQGKGRENNGKKGKKLKQNFQYLDEKGRISEINALYEKQQEKIRHLSVMTERRKESIRRRSLFQRQKTKLDTTITRQEVLRGRIKRQLSRLKTQKQKRISKKYQ